jgi:hypothetical protein
MTIAFRSANTKPVGWSKLHAYTDLSSVETADSRRSARNS